MATFEVILSDGKTAIETADDAETAKANAVAHNAVEAISATELTDAQATEEATESASDEAAEAGAEEGGSSPFVALPNGSDSTSGAAPADAPVATPVDIPADVPPVDAPVAAPALMPDKALTNLAAAAMAYCAAVNNA
jgi:hypothetical protein